MERSASEAMASASAETRNHVEMLHRLAEPLSRNGKLVVASYGEDPDGMRSQGGRAAAQITPVVEHFRIGDIDGMLAAIARLGRNRHRNVYIPLAVLRADLLRGKKGQEEDVVGVLGFVIDDDPDRDKGSTELLLPANYVLQTSVTPQANRQHFYLLDGIIDVEDAKPVAAALTDFHGTDHGSKDLSHVWRVPGCLNWPNAKKVHKFGRPREPQLVTVLQPWDGSLTAVADLRAALDARGLSHRAGSTGRDRMPDAARANQTQRARQPRPDRPPDAPDRFAALPGWLRTKIVRGRPEGERSGALFDVIANLHRQGWTRQEIQAVIAAHPSGIGAKYAERDDLDREIDRVLQKADHADPAESSARSASNRPTIELRNGALHLIATEAEEALVAGGAPFYVRGGKIVKPVVEEVDAAHGALTKVARLREIDQDAMLDWLSRCAVWMKLDARKGRLVAADPTVAIARTVLAREGEWRLPQIVGVITTPTLRPDGSILRIEGYDPATRLVLVEPPPMPEIPDRPSRADALQALELLDELLVDFPFVDDASRSVALSALITPVVRGALTVAPLHVARAPTPGSGKSYLIDLAAAIAIGRSCPVVAAGRTEDETEKRLGAALLAGQPIVSIDNLNGELSGDALCQMVERPVVQIRTLGLSKLTEIESRATVFATGNNIVLVGDMVRRVVVCSLDPDVERPELRRFTTNPLAAVLERRGHYVAAALTVVRAYVSAGCPDPRQPLASFEDWSRLVRSPLTWLGRADPVATMEVARGEDPETQALREVVATWYEAIGPNVRLTAREMTARAEETHLLGEGDYQQLPQRHLKHPALHDALVAIASDRSGINPQRLGNWLGRRKGRVVDGHKIVSLVDKHAKQTRWYLSDAP